VQNYGIIRGKEARAFQTWIEEIEKTVTTKLKPILEINNLLLPSQAYAEQNMNSSFTVTEISAFVSLLWRLNT
jgi:hypothetical protein